MFKGQEKEDEDKGEDKGPDGHGRRQGQTKGNTKGKTKDKTRADKEGKGQDKDRQRARQRTRRRTRQGQDQTWWILGAGITACDVTPHAYDARRSTSPRQNDDTLMGCHQGIYGSSLLVGSCCCLSFVTDADQRILYLYTIYTHNAYIYLDLYIYQTSLFFEFES
jgi:hypothetical protein